MRPSPARSGPSQPQMVSLMQLCPFRRTSEGPPKNLRNLKTLKVLGKMKDLKLLCLFRRTSEEPPKNLRTLENVEIPWENEGIEASLPFPKNPRRTSEEPPEPKKR